MNIALVADWLPTFAGAEHVIAEFHRLWPEAPLYTTIANHGHLGPLDQADIRTTPLQFPYTILRNHRILLPWMTKHIENIDLRGYDVVLSSSHAIGKGIIPPSSAVHVCYCHTPMRYAWEMEETYLQDSRIPQLFHSKLKKMLANIRRWDLTTSKRVDVFIANSTTTQERIRRIYNRDSVVLSPPVQDSFFRSPLQQGNGKYYVALGRLVPYKRFDLLVHAANASGIPLKIAGTGPELQRLQRMAGDTVDFVGYVPDADLPALYSNAKALLFPQLEDAGVVPLEAQACGTPVIALGQGGILDTVVHEQTGIFFATQDVPSLLSAVKNFERTTFDHAKIREHAKQFSSAVFTQKLQDLLHQSHLQYRQPAPLVRPLK